MINVKMCPKFEATFTLLGKRWTGLIIRAILFGQHHFSEIAQLIPLLNDRMLSKRLKELKAVGIVKRTVYPEISPQAHFLPGCWWRASEILLRKTQAWKSIPTFRFGWNMN